MISRNSSATTRWTVTALCLGARCLSGCAVPTPTAAAKPGSAVDVVEDGSDGAGPTDCGADSAVAVPLADVCPADDCLASAPGAADAPEVDGADAADVEIDIGPCDGLFLTSGRLYWVDGGGTESGKKGYFDFDAVALGQAVTTVVPVINTKSPDPESITGVEIVGSPAFAVRFGACTEWARKSGGLPCGRNRKTVHGREKLPILVRFAPINPGLHTAVITLLLEDPCESVTPLTLSVSGVGKE